MLVLLLQDTHPHSPSYFSQNTWGFPYQQRSVCLQYTTDTRLRRPPALTRHRIHHPLLFRASRNRPQKDPPLRSARQFRSCASTSTLNCMWRSICGTFARICQIFANLLSLVNLLQMNYFTACCCCFVDCERFGQNWVDFAKYWHLGFASTSLHLCCSLYFSQTDLVWVDLQWHYLCRWSL